MKKTMFVFTFLAITCNTYAVNSIEGKLSYFRPNSSVLRNIFSEWMPLYQVEGVAKVWKDFHIWASVGYLHKNGRSLEGHQSTSIQLVPVTLGLEYLIHFSNCSTGYLGLGPRYFCTKITNRSHFVHRHDLKNGLGGAFRVGGLIYFTPHFLLDLCIDYSIKEFKPGHSSSTIQRHELNLSGLSLGVGLGYSW